MGIYVLAILITVGVFTGLSIVLLIAEKYLADYGTCIITINNGESVIEQQGGCTLLSALYDNKVFIPSACGGKGSCGHCKATVVSGGGPVLPTETTYLGTHGNPRGYSPGLPGEDQGTYGYPSA